MMSLYQKKRTIVDWVVLFLVVIVAGVIIKLSFTNTTKIAAGLSINPYVLAGLIEIVFAVLLFIRGRQRAVRRNVPLFVHVLYYVSFTLVTWSNMYGLYKEDHFTGLIIGGAISGFMLGLENMLVWLWTRSHEPYKKSILRQKIDAIKEAWEEKMIQEIYWIKYNAKRAHLGLVKKVRRTEQKRKKVIGDDLPEFFHYLEKQDPVKEITAELHRTEPRTINVQDESTAVIPIKRPIGFNIEQTEQQPNEQPLTKTEQAEQYIIKLIKQNKDYTIREVANKIGCSPSVVQAGKQRAEQKLGIK